MQKKLIRVNFALLDEIKTQFEAVKKIASQWESSASKLHGVARDAQEFASDVKSLQKEAYAEFDKVIQKSRELSKMAQELGVERPKLLQEVFGYGDLEDLQAYSEQAIQKISNAIK